MNKPQKPAGLHTHNLNACTSCRERRNSILSRRCALRTRSSVAAEQERGLEAAPAILAGARALRAPIGFRGYVRGVRGGCLRSARRGGGHLPGSGVSHIVGF
jgi:hypothetical protein